MATPTVSVAATKIDVTSTGGAGSQSTLDEIYLAINDVTVMTRTGTGPYTYLIKRASGQIYREFEISANCTVEFEDDDALNWEGITNSGTYYVFDMASGSKTIIGEGFTFDFNSDSQTYNRAYVISYGELEINGVSGNEVVLKGYRSFYDYSRAAQDWNYVTLKNCTYASGYIYYHANYALTDDYSGTRSYDHITITNDSGHDGRVYFTDMGNASGRSFTNWTITDITYVLFHQATMKCVDWVFVDIYTGVQIYGCGNSVGSQVYDTSKSNKLFFDKQFQPAIVFDGCSFGTITNGSSCANIYYGSTVYARTCTFHDESYGPYVRYGSRFIEYGDATTFTNISAANRLWANDGTYLRAREIEVTVNDETGARLEGATVSIIQMPDRKEKWAAITDSSGAITDMYGYGPRLIEREETSAGVFENWSDDDTSGTGTAYHVIMVSYPGYISQSREIEVNENKEMSFALQPVSRVFVDDKKEDVWFYPGTGDIIHET